MPPAPPPPPATVDFDSSEYDVAMQSNNKDSAVQAALEDIFHNFNVALIESETLRRGTEDAVDSCLASCLEAVSMQYPAREDNPVTLVSLQHCSWEAEQAPQPCAADSWLRGAIPDHAPASTSGSHSWAMQQYLVGGGRQGSASVRQSNPGHTDDLAFPPNVLGLQASTSGPDSHGGGLDRSLTSKLRVTTKIDTNKALTPEQEQLEEQLRQELQQRKQQEELRGRLQQKDAEERAKLASLRKELKGKDYTYDHKGEVVILNEFDPEKTPLESLSGPAFKIAAPEDPNRSASPKKRTMSRATSGRSIAPPHSSGGAALGGTTGTGGLSGTLPSTANNANLFSTAMSSPSTTMSPSEMRRERERRLQNDYKKAPPKTQPSAMDTLTPVGGVTLRQGAATKSGPLKPQQAGLTREAYQKQLARKAMREERMTSLAEARTGAGMGMGGPDAMTGRTPSAAGGALVRNALGGPSNGGTAAAVIAAARAAIQAESAAAGQRDPLKGYGYEGEVDIMRDAKPKRASSGRHDLVKPQTPDMNLILTGALDWGMGGRGRGFEPPPSLAASKPTERQLVETVGRHDRLPRDRGALATLAPPIAPSKVGLAASKESTGRLQFVSPLSTK